MHYKGAASTKATAATFIFGDSFLEGWSLSEIHWFWLGAGLREVVREALGGPEDVRTSTIAHTLRVGTVLWRLWLSPWGGGVVEIGPPRYPLFKGGTVGLAGSEPSIP